MRSRTAVASWLGLGAALSVALAPAIAAAAGYDTPILYSARHQAMGGTAIAYVSDPSAGFHNPAGLQGVQGLGAIADFSLILGKIRASPEKDADGGANRESDVVTAPFFLVGAGYRLKPWLTLGLAGFPVASGAGEYRFDVLGSPNIDATRLVFFEITPLLSLNIPEDAILPGRLAIGAGYRTSIVTFERKKGGPVDDPLYANFELSGADFKGFRIGAQYRPIEALQLGVVFRNKVVVTAKGDSGRLVNDVRDVTLDFTLPAKLGLGMRADAERLGVATDVELAFQSQNGTAMLAGVRVNSGKPADVANVFNWQDGITWRFGLEYRLGQEQSWPIRIGYIFDSTVTNPAYPSAFGTPPGPTRTFTAGAGYRAKHWQVNLAASRRFGEAHVLESELDHDACQFCAYAGQYEITMTGLYADISVDLPL